MLVFENQVLKQISGLKREESDCGHTGCEFMPLLVARIRAGLLVGNRTTRVFTLNEDTCC